MSSIHRLLNPISSDAASSCQLPSPSSTVYTREYSSTPPPRKRQKVAKDAAVFTRNNIRGECRYPPCEYRDEPIASYHQEYGVYPLGRIAEYPRHIPYNSEKKSFQEKTGREFFEVFHYEFRIPGEEKVYCMMWDYNIGLVRTTPLFRCNGFSKTTPAKMLNRNPGLRDLCHSITGGALVAQGYWMPFEAAKAVAATFCYHMRYALTPIFGTQFPEECLKPDQDGFGEMIIDEAIIRLCREEAICYRRMEVEKHGEKKGNSQRSTPLSTVQKTLRTKTRGLHKGKVKNHGQESNVVSATTSPATSSYRGEWTPTNTPRSVPPRNPDSEPTSPREALAKAVRHARDIHDSDCSSQTSREPTTPSSPFPVPPKQSSRAGSRRGIRYSDGIDEESGSDEDGVRLTDEKAAYVLVSLKMGQTSLRGSRNGTSRLRKRRASA